MKQAKDYIIFALDVPSAKLARQLTSRLKDSVGMFKIGLELFVRCGPELVRWIRENTGVGIFLDLKLHDIPETVKRTMQAIAALDVDLATIHCGDGHSMIQAAVAGSQNRVGILGVTVLTSVSDTDLKTAGYKDEICLDLSGLVMKKAAMAQAAGCAGVVCSGLEAKRVKSQFGKGFLAVTPGVRPVGKDSQKDDQRRVVTPAIAVSNGADYIVVGRPIRDAADPADAARSIADEIEAVL